MIWGGKGMIRERIGLLAIGIVEAIMLRRRVFVIGSALAVLAVFAVFWVGAYDEYDYEDGYEDYYEEEAYYDENELDVYEDEDEEKDEDYYDDEKLDEDDELEEYEEQEEAEDEYEEEEEEDIELIMPMTAPFLPFSAPDFDPADHADPVYELQRIINDQPITGITTINLMGTVVVGSTQSLTLVNDIIFTVNSHFRHFEVTGGGILNLNNVNIQGRSTTNGHYSRILANRGGGIFINGGIVNMSGGAIRFVDNSSVDALETHLFGGAVLLDGGEFNMSDGVIERNSASAGGGVRVNGGTFTMSNNAHIRYNNHSGDLISGHIHPPTGGPSEGGGVFVLTGGSFNMTGGQITGNVSMSGSGVYIDGIGGHNSTFTMSGGRIHSNGQLSSSGVATGHGGGVFLNESSMTMSGSAIIGARDDPQFWFTEGNFAHQGGGIYSVDSTITINGGAIRGNAAVGTAGGIRVGNLAGQRVGSSSLTMNNGIIENNVTRGFGGGILVVGNTTFTMNNGHIRGNIAGEHGGGVNVSDITSTTINNGTISNNRAGRGGGIHRDLDIEQRAQPARIDLVSGNIINNQAIPSGSVGTIPRSDVLGPALNFSGNGNGGGIHLGAAVPGANIPGAAGQTFHANTPDAINTNFNRELINIAPDFVFSGNTARVALILTDDGVRTNGNVPGSGPAPFDGTLNDRIAQTRPNSIRTDTQRLDVSLLNNYDIDNLYPPTTPVIPPPPTVDPGEPRPSPSPSPSPSPTPIPTPTPTPLPSPLPIPEIPVVTPIPSPIPIPEVPIVSPPPVIPAPIPITPVVPPIMPPTVGPPTPAPTPLPTPTPTPPPVPTPEPPLVVVPEVPDEPGPGEPPITTPPEGGIQIAIPPTGGPDDNNIPWIVTPGGNPTIDIERVPPHLEVVPNEDGSYSIYQIDPQPPTYLGTYHPTYNPLEKIFIPNPNIPLGLIQIPECPLVPWWMWPLLGALLLPWLIALFRRREMTVKFETGIDEKNYFQVYERGDLVDVPVGFEKEAHMLDGWYRDKKYSDKKKWDFDKKIRKNMTLYAKWISPGEMT